MGVDHKELMCELTSYYDTYSEYLTEASFQRSFGYGITQWRSDQRELMRRLQIPTLQKNEMAKHIKSAVSEFAGNIPALEVKCYNPSTDSQIVKQYQQIVHSIDNAAEQVKVSAYEGMLRTGLTPALFVTLDYDNDTTFNQSIKLRYIDYESFYFDVGSQTSTKEDASYVGYLRRVSKDHFKRQWPEAEANSVEALTATGNSADAWVWDNMEDEVILAHHFKKVYGKKRKIYLTSLGRTLDNREEVQPNEEIIDERECEDMHIECYLMSGSDILEEPIVYPVNFLPLVGCQGYQALVKGRIYPYSYGNELQDMQRLQNYVLSQIGAGTLYSRQSKTLWDKETLDKNTMNQLLTPGAPADIFMDLSEVNKRPINWPAQQISPSLLQLYEGTSGQIDSTFGRYETSQGASSGSVTGIAKSMEINQANLPLYYYLQPMITALNRVGKILNHLIPEIYMDRHQIRGTNSQVEINTGDDTSLNFNEEFKEEDYDIYIKAGASFTIQRETYRKSMEMIFKEAPAELKLLITPAMLQLMDVPNLPQLEDIYKKFIALMYPELYGLLKDVSESEIETVVEEAKAKKEEAQQTQEQMQTAMQEMAMQKEQQEMKLQALRAEVEQRRVATQEAELQLKREELQLKDRRQEANELQNMSNYQVRTEEIDQRQRDNDTKLAEQHMKNKAEVIKAAISTRS